MPSRSVNTLYPKPDYNHHRISAGVDPAIGSMDPTGAINCRGWKTVTCILKVSPSGTATVQPLEVARYPATPGEASALSEELTAIGSALGPFADGKLFDVTVNGGRLLVQVTALAGGATGATVLVAGAEVQVDAALGGR